jgi:hypothetical protein
MEPSWASWPRWWNMTGEVHFERVADWAAAAKLLTFEPRCPAYTAGHALASLYVHVMDHRKRRLPVGARSLEAHYGSFVVDQKRTSSEEDAMRWALSTSYGQAPVATKVAGHEARSYALGPEAGPDDVDGRRPAVVVWNDGDMVYLVASDRLDDGTLRRIASSMYG